jgi:hypothetical protein
MRIACVAGFFNPVKSSIEKAFAKELKENSVVWVPQLSNGQINQNRLKQAIFDATARGATDLLMLLFLLRGSEYVRQVVDSLAAEAIRRSPGLRITINQALRNAQDGPGVVKLIQKFAPVVVKTYPASLDTLESWTAEHHSDKIFFMSRAVNNAGKSQFEDVRLIFQAIEVLAVEYHAMRISKPEDAEKCRVACEGRIKELGLELSPSISAARASEEGDDYYVYYPPGQLKDQKLLDLHLKKGSDRDQRYCLRIYFFWDDKLNKVIIGWLPNHLDTRAT